ncbi:hypothetical protein TorRG33x02_308030 [Trema orientale]|uniref:Uncharacterized protein n=1 Tax=Trema orientale TaxID=63057 RepID=A0A2P5BUS4_TREOI|nr:hypothetical protein TorRG33x02_308030 [Trema orientale]
MLYSLVPIKRRNESTFLTPDGEGSLFKAFLTDLSVGRNCTKQNLAQREGESLGRLEWLGRAVQDEYQDVIVLGWICSRMGKERCCKWFRYNGIYYSLEE